MQNDVQRLVKHAPDFVLEPNAAALLEEFFRNAGEPLETIDHLCKNYKGFPEMFHLMASEWAPELNLSPNEIEKQVVVETLREFLSHEYDKAKADKLIDNPMDCPEWLSDLALDENWRATFCSLAKEHKDSLLLAIALRIIILNKNYDGVSNLEIITWFVDSFSLVLEYHLTSVLPLEDHDVFSAQLNSFLKVCSSDVNAYVYTQMILCALCSRVSRENARGIRRIAKDIEISARKLHPNSPVIRAIRMYSYAENVPENIADAVWNILSLSENNLPSSDDIELLYAAYRRENPPPTEPIFDAEIIGQSLYGKCG